MAGYMWLNLKLDLLPCIAQEVEKITKDYLRLSEEVRKGNNQAYQELVVLQANIRARIEEFDRFYDRNYADYRIAYFEKMKLRLRKLLSPHIDVNRLIYEDGLQYQNKMSQQTQGNSQGRNYSPNPSAIPQQQNQQSPQTKQQVSTSPNQKMPSKSPQTSIINKQQQTQPNKSPQQPKQANQQQQQQQQRPQTTAQTSHIAQPKQQPTKQAGGGAKNKGDEGQKDELVFTIKMTKEEYLQYLQARQTKSK